MPQRKSPAFPKCGFLIDCKIHIRLEKYSDAQNHSTYEFRAGYRLPHGSFLDTHSPTHPIHLFTHSPALFSLIDMDFCHRRSWATAWLHHLGSNLRPKKIRQHFGSWPGMLEILIGPFRIFLSIISGLGLRFIPKHLPAVGLTKTDYVALRDKYQVFRKER